MHLATQDLAKYGLCLLHHGVYNGEQVIPESWVVAATAKQVENASEYPVARSENRQGYGYQFWMCTHDAFRCSGLHGQLCFVQPKNQLVIAMSNATTGSQAVLNCLFEAMDYPKTVEPFTEFSIPMAGGKASSCDTIALQGTLSAMANPAGSQSCRYSRRTPPAYAWYSIAVLNNSHLALATGNGFVNKITGMVFQPLSRQTA